jgi:hypothetical protein
MVFEPKLLDEGHGKIVLLTWSIALCLLSTLAFLVVAKALDADS